jgi:hypothetical protein
MISISRRGFFTLPFMVAAILMNPVALSAQLTDDQALAEARALLKSGREQVVREELELTKNEATTFWPLYEKYRNDIERVRDRQAQMISRYLSAYDSADLSDNLAKEMLDEHLSIKSDLLKLERKYLRQFRKTLPEAKVARFYQLENKLDAEIDIALADLMPLFEAS